jgi:ATP-dependent RNA helicase RhlE
MPFSKLGLSDELLKAINEQNYSAPYPIQIQAIPAILRGKDVVGIAQTGSGKTASFVLPILELFQKTNQSTKSRHVKALILVPTRELAIQIKAVFTNLGKYLTSKTKSLAVYGGVSINPQMIELQGVEVLIATPGRLLELISANAVFLSLVQLLVLDEADKMLNQGFKDELDQIISLLPAKRQTLMYSATLSKEVENTQKNLLKQPIIIEAGEEISNLDLIEQTVYLISEEKKGPLLRYLIKHFNMQQVLVFTSSVQRADNVTTKLKANGIEAYAMHSKKSQGGRLSALNDFKSGRIRVLVATDIMSRGIDIQYLPYVINYELPRSPKDYVHRIGRTGRAESKGEAISLITPADEHHYKIIQKKMGKMANLIDANSIELRGY